MSETDGGLGPPSGGGGGAGGLGPPSGGGPPGGGDGGLGPSPGGVGIPEPIAPGICVAAIIPAEVPVDKKDSNAS